MSYPGGKGSDGVYQRIINQIPPHDLYIEAFVGAGAVLLHKRPAFESIVIDTDATIAARWAAASNAELSDRIPQLHAECGDAISLLRLLIAKCGVADQKIFIYCDPPYMLETRRSKRSLYSHEMTMPDQHRDLLDLVVSLDCMVAISGYWSSLYAARLKGWRSISYQAGTRGGTCATEWLWMNYPEPVELHDYRYLGSNFREREKINRQRRRWIAKLQKMPVLQRYALIAALAEFEDTTWHS